GPMWRQGDLSTLDLDIAEPFDAAVMAGNVMTFLAEGTESEVLRRVAAHVRADSAVVVGFGMGRGYSPAAFDDDIASAGLHVEQRFGTWDLRPLTDDSDFMVTVLRVPAEE